MLTNRTDDGALNDFTTPYCSAIPGVRRTFDKWLERDSEIQTRNREAERKERQAFKHTEEPRVEVLTDVSTTDFIAQEETLFMPQARDVFRARQNDWLNTVRDLAAANPNTSFAMGLVNNLQFDDTQEMLNKLSQVDQPIKSSFDGSDDTNIR